MIDIPLKQMPDIHGHQPVFQPIVSLKEKRIIGFEALTRCLDDGTGCLSPEELFEDARNTGLDEALDRISRDNAIRAFAESGWRDRFSLFLNVEPSGSPKRSSEKQGMRATVEEMGLEPARVAIEIVESRMDSTEELSALVEGFRREGFRIVLDNFGAEHFHLDRINLLRPDLVKIDRKLVHGVADDFCRRSMVRAIVGSAERVGTPTLALGVETNEDILTCYELGIHFFQGFRFSRPAPPNEPTIPACTKILSQVFEEMYGGLEARVRSRIKAQRTIEETARNLCAALEGKPAGQFEDVLREKISSFCGVQCLFVLDQKGQQVGETLFAEPPAVSPGHPFFTPSSPGTDHSLKPYFCQPKILGAARFFTDSYLSLATGALCRTLSARFEGEGGTPHFLCIDVDAQFPEDCPAPNG
jgi:EAL domain-containing protein (putative c-di-GMP-specific phosphodiesterase class I)